MSGPDKFSRVQIASIAQILFEYVQGRVRQC